MKPRPASRWIAVAACLSVPLAGCGSPGPIPSSTATPYMPQWREPAAVSAAERIACTDAPPAPVAFPSAMTGGEGLPLSPGDTVRINVPQGDEFTGLFTVDADGTLKLPYIAPIQAAGQPAVRLEALIVQELVGKKLFRASFVRVSVQPVQWAPAQIAVAGAVFQPGTTIINERKNEDRAKPDTAAAGDYSPGRTISAAIRSAGGLRPDADLRRVSVERAGRQTELDLSGLLSGAAAADIPLVAGDRISVPSRGCFQDAMVRPSAVTPAGIRIFVSNLTSPASSNAQSAVNKEATSLPYGTRLLQGLISANCVGGNASTNSGRYAVLVTTNPVTGQSEVLERDIEQMVRDPKRDAYNPYLLPNDGIACYDSDSTNIRDVARAITEIIAPLALLGVLGRVVGGKSRNGDK